MIVNVPLDRISANPWQTRESVDPEYIQELANDIAINGLLQEPAGRMMGSVSLEMYRMAEWRQIEAADGLLQFAGGQSPFVQLAFGHNRLAAYRLLSETGQKWASMPVKLTPMDDEKMADSAWAENERRRDVTPIERAKAIQMRMRDFAWSQEDAALHTGMSRSAVANCLRLLKLPGDVQADLQHGVISERQATALLPLWDAAEEIPAGSSTARSFGYAIELLVNQARDGDSSATLRERVGFNIAQMRRQLQPELVPPAPEPAPEPPATLSVETMRQPAPTPAPAHVPESAPTEKPYKSVTFEDIVDGQRRQAEEDQQRAQEEAPAPAGPRAPATPHPEAAPTPPIQAPAVLKWADSTIVVAITLLPEDGHSLGRPAMISLRTNNGLPVMRMGRENQVTELFQNAIAEARQAAGG